MHFGSFIEIKVLLGPPNHCLVRFVEILLSDHISIFADSLHACFLADAGYVCGANLVRTTHVLLQIYILRKIHFGCDCLENEPLLAAIGKRELYLSIQAARP